MFVFDLDFTLWNCAETYLDCTRPPFAKNEGRVCDSTGGEMKLFPDALPIIKYLTEQGAVLAIASRTYQPEWAEELLELLGVKHFFPYREIYPASKRKHIAKLHEKTAIPYENIFFFDDEYRNISDVKTLGVNCLYIDNGINQKEFEEFTQIKICI